MRKEIPYAVVLVNPHHIILGLCVVLACGSAARKAKQQMGALKA